MDANVFYQMWNSAIASDDTKMENLDMFDDLDLLDEDCNVTSDITELQESIEQPCTEQIMCITDTNESSEKYKPIKSYRFNKVVKEASAQNNIAPLKQAISDFCVQYDYKDLKDFIKVDNLNYNDLILEWLSVVYGVIIDTSFDEVILQYDKRSLEQVCSLYRNMFLSELIMIAQHLNKNYFDASVIQNYSLEMRDTGLLLGLMRDNLFNQEEATLYLNNVETFNAYLLLKASGKFEASVFETVKQSDANLNSYAKTVLSNNPWAFLGSHKDFSNIMQLVANKDLPLEVAERFKDNPYLYQILLAYSEGLYSNNFILNYLREDNIFSEQMANEYAEIKIDAQTLNAHNGNFYLAKLVYDVKQFKMNSKLFIDELNKSENTGFIYDFAKNLLDLVYDNKINYSEWLKFMYYLAKTGNISICIDYLKYSNEQGEITFNQFWYLWLISQLNIVARIPNDVGELVLYQNGESVAYFNVQMIWEAGTTLVQSVTEKLVDDVCVKLLPDKKGIIICQKTFSKFNEERVKFQKFADCKSSTTYAIENSISENIDRFNIYKLMSISSEIQSGSASESFKCLTMITPEKYLVYDNLLNLICTTYTEFAGLCMSSEAIQCLKLFNNMLKLPSRVEVQVEFLKAYLTFKFKNRIRFEHYNANLMQELKFIEVKNSYNYSDCSFAKVISSLDNFTNDLNKKNYIICKFDGINRMIFEGA